MLLRLTIHRTPTTTVVVDTEKTFLDLHTVLQTVEDVKPDSFYFTLSFGSTTLKFYDPDLTYLDKRSPENIQANHGFLSRYILEDDINLSYCYIKDKKETDIPIEVGKAYHYYSTDFYPVLESVSGHNEGPAFDLVAERLKDVQTERTQVKTHPKKRALLNVYEKLDDLILLNPWDKFKPNQVMSTFIEPLDTYAFFHFAHDEEKRPTLYIYQNLWGYDTLETRFKEGHIVEDNIPETSYLAISVINPDDLEDPSRDYLDSLGVSSLNNERCPYILSKRLNHMVGYPTTTDNQVLELLLPILLDLTKSNALSTEKWPEFPDAHTYLMVDGDAKDLSTKPVKLEEAFHKKMVGRYETYLSLDDLKIKRLKKKVKQTRKTFELSIEMTEHLFSFHPYEAQFIPFNFLLMNHSSGAVLYNDGFSFDYSPEDIQETLYYIFHTLGELPKKILVDDKEIYQKFKPLTDALDIEIKCVMELKKIEDFLMDQMLFEDFSDFD